jgi:integrase
VAKKLTAVAVENAKPRKDRYELPDGGCKGLYLVIQPSGSKSWAVRYRHAGKPKKLTLEPESGATPLTPAGARKRAGDALHRVEQGIDPAQEKRAWIATSRDAAAIRAADSVEHLAAQYIERYCKAKNRAWQQVEGIFRREILPRWGARSIHDITREDVEDLIDAIAADDRPVMANRTLAAVRKWYAWMGGKSKGGRKATMKSRLTNNPCFGVEAPGKEQSRERVLTDTEIVALWKAADTDGEPYGSFSKILLLTGQRRGEVAGMRHDELDLDKALWSLPSSRTKNKRPHVIPLSVQAVAIIKAMMPAADDYVFTAARGRAIAAFHPFKERLDQRMATAPGSWTLHDVRRTVATGMAAVGVQPRIVEAVLNHVSGVRAGVAGTYNRHLYLNEKRQALEFWGAHIERLVTGEPAKIVPLRPRAQAAEPV